MRKKLFIHFVKIIRFSKPRPLLIWINQLTLHLQVAFKYYISTLNVYNAPIGQADDTVLVSNDILQL